MRPKLVLTFWFLLVSVVAVAAQTGTCPAFVQQALDTAEEQCTDTGRNQICYGHTALEADPQPDGVHFKLVQK